jgi:hypothetical protein
MWLCVVDVLALASGLGSLAADLRDARTAIWCMLQLASNDLPAKSIEFTRQLAGEEDGVAPSAASAKFATIASAMQHQMLEYMNSFRPVVEALCSDADGLRA